MFVRAFFDENITIQKIPVFFAGHIVVENFKGSQNFRLLIEAIFEKKYVPSIVAEIRKASRIKFHNVVRASLDRHPDLTLKSIFSERSRKLDFFDKNSPDAVNMVWEIGCLFLHRGEFERAFSVFALMEYDDKVILQYPCLLSWHGEFLCYNITSRKFAQTNKHRLPEHHGIIYVNLKGLFVIENGERVYISSSTGRSGDRIFVTVDGKNLCSNVDGSVSLMPHVLDFEKYWVTTFSKSLSAPYTGLTKIEEQRLDALGDL